MIELKKRDTRFVNVLIDHVYISYLFNAICSYLYDIFFLIVHFVIRFINVLIDYVYISYLFNAICSY